VADHRGSRVLEVTVVSEKVRERLRWVRGVGYSSEVMSNFNPYAAPQMDGHDLPAGGMGGGPARLEGKAVVVPKGAYLPNLCVKCATAEGLTRKNHKFAWTPVWARVMIAFCTIGGIVAILVTTKRAALELPFCAPCLKRLSNARWLAAAAAIVTVLIFLGVFLVPDQLAWLPAVLALVGLIGLIVVLAAVVRPRGVQCNKIDATSISLLGIDPRTTQVILTTVR